MKKLATLFSLFLLLAGMIPTAAAAGIVTIQEEACVLDLDTFTLTLSSGDAYQTGPKDDAALMLAVVPDYAPTALYQGSISVCWLEPDTYALFPTDDDGLLAFATANGNDSAEQVTQSGIPCTMISCQVLDNVTIDGVEFMVVEHISLWDYSSITGGQLGELQVRSTQFIASFADGGYVFALNSYSDEEYQSLLSVMNTFDLKD